MSYLGRAQLLSTTAITVILKCSLRGNVQYKDLLKLDWDTFFKHPFKLTFFLHHPILIEHWIMTMLFIPFPCREYIPSPPRN